MRIHKKLRIRYKGVRSIRLFYHLKRSAYEKKDPVIINPYSSGFVIMQYTGKGNGRNDPDQCR